MSSEQLSSSDHTLSDQPYDQGHHNEEIKKRERRNNSWRDDLDSNPYTRKERKRHTRMPVRSLEEINLIITDAEQANTLTEVMHCLGTYNQLGESDWHRYTYPKQAGNTAARRHHINQSPPSELEILRLFQRGKRHHAERRAEGDDRIALEVLGRFWSKLSSVDLDILQQIFRDIKERLSGLRGAGRPNTRALKIHFDERLLPNSLHALLESPTISTHNNS